MAQSQVVNEILKFDPTITIKESYTFILQYTSTQLSWDKPYNSMKTHKFFVLTNLKVMKKFKTKSMAKILAKK